MPGYKNQEKQWFFDEQKTTRAIREVSNSLNSLLNKDLIFIHNIQQRIHEIEFFLGLLSRNAFKRENLHVYQSLEDLKIVIHNHGPEERINKTIILETKKFLNLLDNL